MMIIEIKIENRQIALILKDKKNMLDSFIFPEERRLSEDLLPAIDRMLKKHNLQPADIQKMTVKSDLGENFTTCRIAKITAKTWNWISKNQKKSKLGCKF